MVWRRSASHPKHRGFRRWGRGGGASQSESVRLEFTLNEPREISELYEADPNEWGPEVYAVAKVVSSRTGEPLEGVEVFWDFSGPALRPSLTDKDGIARLTF